MNKFLKTYTLTFKTKAPVFIGNGKTISKKEYIYDRSEGCIHFMDMDRMYHALSKLRLGGKYEQYLLNDDYTDLSGFLKENDIRANQYQAWIKYSEPVGDPEMNSHSIKNICAFVKDPYGKPYIPGSSLKGALRTMLEVSYLLRNKNEFASIAEEIHRAEYKGRTNYLKKETDKIKEKVFHEELFHDRDGRCEHESIVNDILRGIRVSDSAPLNDTDLCICQKVDLTTGGEFKKLNLVRECIRPDVMISMKITVDSAFYKYTNIDILNAVEDFYRNVSLEFLSRFNNGVPTRGNKTTFFLGGGAGYPSKTVLYGLLHGSEARAEAVHIIDQSLPEAVRRKHGHARDNELGASPHMLKCTIYGKKKYQMGACCIIGI